MKPVYLTAVYKGIESGIQAQVIGMDERICAMSWSHAIDEKNEAQDKIKELSKQRDELLEALKFTKLELDKFNNIRGGAGVLFGLCEVINSAIANAEK